MEAILLGIDIGTSACKIAAFDTGGRVVAQSTKEYRVYYPAQDCVEQNPLEWWQKVCEGIRETLSTGDINPKQIAGIGVDGQSWSAIPVDKNGEVLYNTPIWMDTRASEIARRVTERIGFEKIFGISGNSFSPTYSTSKMLWFKEQLPEIYKKTYKFLQSNSYIVFKLTGKFTQDLSQGYGIHAFDIRKGEWDDAFCDELGISREKLPDIFPCHQIVGEVLESVCEETGLVKGIPVVCGGLDACCGTLGAGVISRGQVQEQGGQAGGMSICLDEALAHPKLILGFHVVPDRWLLQGGTVGGGGCIKWFRQELCGYEVIEEKETGVSAFKIMDKEAAGISPGSDGVIFLPYMAGERSPLWDKNAKGVFYGLGFNKTRAHMIRAVMEGSAYALEHNLQTAREAGVGFDVLNAVGGAANSDLWMQIKADVTGKVIKVPDSTTATTLGAAILAGVGTGIYKSFEEAVGRTVKIKKTYEPDMKRHALYKKYFEIYLEIYEKLKDTLQKNISGV